MLKLSNTYLIFSTGRVRGYMQIIILLTRVLPSSLSLTLTHTHVFFLFPYYPQKEEEEEEEEDVSRGRWPSWTGIPVTVVVPGRLLRKREVGGENGWEARIRAGNKTQKGKEKERIFMLFRLK